MPRPKNNAAEGEREFQMTLLISDNGPCRVVVSERGERAKMEASTPLGGLLGVRETLRMGGLLVRQFHATRQRALDLRARHAEVLRRQLERRNRPETPSEAPEGTPEPERFEETPIGQFLQRGMAAQEAVDDAVAAAEPQPDQPDAENGIPGVTEDKPKRTRSRGKQAAGAK